MPPGSAPQSGGGGNGLAIGCLAVFLTFLLLLLAHRIVIGGGWPEIITLLALAGGCIWLMRTVSRGATPYTQPPSGVRAGTGPPSPDTPPPREQAPLPADLLERLARLEREAAELRALIERYAAAVPVAGVPAIPPAPAMPIEPAAPSGPAMPTGPEAFAEPMAHLSQGRAHVAEEPKPRTPAVGLGSFWRSLAGPLAGGGAGGATPTEAAAAEARIGTVWFSRIGVLLLIVGAVLGYRYGVTNNLIRVVIGYLAGLILLALGLWGQRRHYRVWALAVTGGGLGVLYLTTIAANMLFHPAIIPDPAAFGLMILVTVLGTGLALFHDSPVIGVLGMAGGFAAAVPLATGPYDFRLLFAYIAILDAGLLLVAYFRRWLLYNFLLFAATWGIYGLWRAGAGRYPEVLAAQAPWAFLFVTVFFLIFAAVTVTSSLTRRTWAPAGRAPEDETRPRQTPAGDLALVIANAFVYFGVGLDLVRPAFSQLGAFLALSLAAAYLALGYLVWAKNREDRPLVLCLLGLAVVFLTVTFPVALDGSWITIAWALEGAALVWLGFLAAVPQARWGGLAVLALAAVRLGLWDTFPASFGLPLPGPAARALTFLISVAAFYVAAAAYAPYARYKGRRDALGALVVAANVFTLWYLTLEVCLHYRQAWYSAAAGLAAGGGAVALAPVAGLVALTLSAVWGFYGLGVSLADLRFRQTAVRAGARVVLALAVVFLLAGWAAVAKAEAGPATRALAVTGVLGSVWIAELIIRRRGLDAGVNGALSLAATAAAFGVVAMETARFLAPFLAPALGRPLTWEFTRWQASVRMFALCAAWGTYALLVAVAGAWLRSASAKVAAAVYFLVAIAAAAFWGVPNLAAPPALRAAGFLFLVPGTYLAAFIAARSRRRREGALEPQPGASDPAAPPPSDPAARPASGLASRPAPEVLAWTATALTAGALTAWWGGAEIAALQYDAAWGRGASSFAVLAWLGLYALAVGVAGRRLRSSPARWLAVVLHGLSLAGLMAIAPFARAWWPFSGAAFAGVVLGLYASSAVFRAPPRAEAGQSRAVAALSLAACAFTALWMALEVHASLAPTGQVPLEVWLAFRSTATHWAILLTGLYGLAVTAVGIRLNSPATRFVGLSIQALATATAFTAGVYNPAASHVLRLAALAGSLGGLYAATWLVRRFAARTTPVDRRATEWLSLAGAAATVVWLTFQAQRYFAPFIAAGTTLERELARSTLDFSVSAVWAAYGFTVLVAGFALRHRYTRILGLGILGLTLGKIGVSDMWHLAVRWRILITIGLGVVFVIASFIYQRFSRVILGPGPEEPPGGGGRGAKGRTAKGAGSAGVLLIALLSGATWLALPAERAMAALDAAEWRYARRITETAAGWVAVELDGPVFAGARPDLADLRVVDESKEEIPWLAVSPAAPSTETVEVRVFDLFTDEKAGTTTFVADLGQSGVVTNRIVLSTTSRNFFKRLTFEAADDLTAWSVLRGDAYIYDLTSEGGGSRLDARYPDTSRRYLRVTVDDMGTPPLEELEVHLERLAAEPDPVTQVPGSVVARGREGGNAWAVIDLGYAGIPVCRAYLTTSATYFRRPVLLEGSFDRGKWEVVAQAAVYRHGADDTAGLAIDFPEASFRFYRLTIMNGDNPAIAPETLALAGVPRRIVFKSPGGRQLFLLYGNPGARAPEYDPAQFTEPAAAQPALAGLGRQLSVITEPETVPPAESPARSTVDPRLWRYERSLELPSGALGSGDRGGFVAVTLDRWVIGAANPDLSDLRLTDDLGLDVPYKVENGLTAVTDWSFNIANAGMESGYHWWALDLGAPNTPSHVVGFESKGSSGTRWVTIDGSNDGQEWSPVGGGTIRRVETIFGLEENLVVSYPVARYRYLRVSVEGQDALFRPSQAKGFAPAIVFRPQLGREYRLFYGNPAATAPAYDPVLFADAYSPLLLGPEVLGAVVDHSPSPPRPSFLVPGEKNPAAGPSEGWARYALWIILGLAVPVLVCAAVVIFRKVMAREAGPSGESPAR